MADNRFFSCRSPQSLSKFKELTGFTVYKDQSINHEIKDVAPLKDAKRGDITFYHNTKYQNDLKATQATACFIHPDHINHAPENLILLVVDRPYRAYAAVACFFYDSTKNENGKPENGHVSHQAFIAPTAKIGKNTVVSPFCVIEENVEIGEGCYIGPHSILHKGVTVGHSSYIGGHVTISHALIGNQVYIKAGARLGQKGFGFEMDDRGHISVPQIGRLLVGDRVEIGANTTVDRGSNADTVIGAGSRIDNLVQIAHNVTLGENCVIVAQSGIAGSTELGRFVIVAGQVGVAGHLKVGDHVRIAAQSGVIRDIPSGQTMAGTPAVPVRDWHKQTIMLSKLIK